MPQHNGPTLPHRKARELLVMQVTKGEGILGGKRVPQAALTDWKATAEAIVVRAVGESSRVFRNLWTAGNFGSGARGRDHGFRTTNQLEDWRNRERLTRMAAVLRNLVEQIDLGLHEPGEGADAETVVDTEELLGHAAFLSDEQLRKMIERDVQELAAAAARELWKCCLVLCGSVLEAALVDVIGRRPDIAQSYMGKRSFPDDASLPQLIEIAAAVDVGTGTPLLSSTAVGVAETLTNHRDVIHPRAEIRTRIRVDRTTAQSMIHLLGLVLRDLADADSRGDLQRYVDM